MFEIVEVRGMGGRFDKVDRAVTAFMGERAITFSRVALAITYIWFGALKIFGVSPVDELVARMVPFMPKKASVPLLGAVEVAIGAGLLFRVALRLTLLLFFLQIIGTFLILIVRPREAFQKGNPLMLTETGEFVIKNLVLLAAGIAVGSMARRESEKIDASIGQAAS